MNQQHYFNRWVLLITHYQRLLEHVKPDFVHVMIDGKIVKTGGAELAAELESMVTIIRGVR